ncbi:uncharacterized protein [Aquarana catesbeiana]|uniref:uncharacterized protein isoform X2 n=1 Tax=Aquarana catesbeiana TaxID=8400 RepID=UPI003CC92A45
MAERTLLGILILLSLCQTYAGLEVFAPSPQRAFVTNDTVLNCTFLLDKQPLDLNFLAILWSFQGKVILRYDNKGFFTEDPRMSLNVESLGDGYASLHISNVTVYHRGTYMCTVIYSPESKEKEILFEALARPVLSILSTKVQINTENTLTCKATGFFPPEIKFTWYRDKEVLKKQLMEKPQEYENGTYQVTSTVTITPTDDDQNKISCKVQHDSLQEPLQWNFQLIYEETSSIVITVVCIILVVMAISVGIGICLWRRKYRKKDMGTFTVEDILPNPTKLIAGEETSLNCKATKFPENTSVTWLEKRRGQVYEIPESHGGDKEEEERLLDTQYGVISCRDGPNFTSSLKFRPSVTNHKDVTFICRYSCGKEKKERTFHCGAIYAKPQLLEPISRSLIVSGELKYLITLEKFYPRNITIRWTHGVGEPQQALPSTETITDIPDGTYNVCSEVRIPGELLKDPESRVRVSWKHETLENLGYKDLSIRDSEYPWRPEVEDIQIPIVLHDTPATLQCHISKYFPNTITVTWLRKIKNQEICEETDKNTITPRRGDSNTYSCTASLTIVPTRSVHQGAEYICRVDHPSLERPIERRTKGLIVMVKPQMAESIEITMVDSSHVLFTLNLQKFYPEHIEIKWTSEYKEKKSEMPCNNNLQKHKDLTYDVTSVGKFPIHVFDDLQTKVSVTWKHESMEEPETRTLTIRDLPWSPKVGEIKIPKLEEDKKESCLTCNISGYFPDLLKVSWFKKEPGTDLQDNVAPVSKDTYKVSNEKELKNKTFFYKSSLTFTPSFGRDQGAEFICRVEHPLLEHPIERRTGPIRIDLPRPQVGEIKTPKLEEDKKATLTCDISGSFLKYINVSWYRKEPGTDSHPSITPLPNDAFKIQTKKIDKTCQSSLTFTPSLSRDQGAEFICRVEYPSLKQPVEKSTGPIKMTTHSVNGTAKAQQKASSRQSKLDKSHKV